MPLRKLSLREIRERPVRSYLTLLSIVIGAGAIVAISLASSAARLAQIAMVEAVTGKTTLEIQGVGGASFDSKSIEFVREQPGIQVASPVIRRYSMMTVIQPANSAGNESAPANGDAEKPTSGDSASSNRERADSTNAEPANDPNTATSNGKGKKGNKQFRVQLLGVDPQLDRAIRNYTLLKGAELDDAPENARGVLIDAGFAESAKVGVGAEVSLLTKSGSQKVKIVGLVQGNDASAALRSAIVIAPLKSVQKWTRSPGKIDLVQIVTAKDTKPEALQDSIQSQLPEGVTVRQPTLRSQIAGESTVAIQQGLFLAAIFAEVLAAFIIFNTFQMNVGERRRQLGVLRALGATRKQILWMILREGIWLGWIGSLIGCVAGYFVATILNSSTSMLLQINIPSSPWSIWPYLAAIGSSLAVSMVGSFVPALMAAFLSPSEAMKVVASDKIKVPNTVWFALAGLLILIGVAIQTLSITQVISTRHTIIGTFIMIFGTMFLVPGSLDWVTYWIEKPVSLLFRTEAKLARRQVLKHRGRSSMLIGIMLIAMAVGLGMASTILDNIRDVQGWYTRAIVGDFFIRAAMPDMNSGQAADMPDGLVERIQAIEGVELVDTLRFVSARSDTTSVVVVVRKFNSETQDYFDLIEGDEKTVLKGVRDGEVVLGSVLSERMNLHRGDTLPLETKDGSATLKIVGVTNEYLAGGLTLYMEAEQAKRMLEVDGTDAIVVKASKDSLHSVEDKLKTLSDEEGLMFQSYSELVVYIEATLNGVVGGLWLVLALGSLIAAFGLINTLAMNILEQTREIGMLRVVAMTRRQIRAMVLSQALIMSLIGILPGVLLGVWIAYVINLSTRQVTGHAIRFQLYPSLLILALIFEIAVVLIAAMFPAERAARINVSKALQYE